MEDNTNNIEVEETSNISSEIDESCDYGSSVIAGIAGGFAAYVIIDGAKRLWRFIADKRAEKKQSKDVAIAVEDVSNPTQEMEDD